MIRRPPRIDNGGFVPFLDQPTQLVNRVISHTMTRPPDSVLVVGRRRGHTTRTECLLVISDEVTVTEVWRVVASDVKRIEIRGEAWRRRREYLVAQQYRRLRSFSPQWLARNAATVHLPIPAMVSRDTVHTVRCVRTGGDIVEHTLSDGGVILGGAIPTRYHLLDISSASRSHPGATRRELIEGVEAMVRGALRIDSDPTPVSQRPARHAPSPRSSGARQS